MEKAISQILTQIARLYDSYQEKSNAMNENQRQKMGAQIDKKEKIMMEQLSKVQQKMATLITQMDKSAAMKQPQLRDCPRVLKECLQDITTITKKKNLLFKVNRHLEELVQGTSQQLDLIRKDIGVAGQTKFLCCGTDGIKKFKLTMQKFKLSSTQWSLLAKLEPKDSVQTFISPKFSSSEYAFIKQILKRVWPQDTVKVEVREVVKTVATGKPSRLAQANQYIYGINKEENPSYGLRIYHQEADNNDTAAASFLGQIYEQGILLPQDLKKATKYYQKAMSGKQPYAYYRFAMALIRGQLRDKGVNREDIEGGYKLLNQVAFTDNPSPEALIELGELYEKGTFEADKEGLYKVPIDLKKAIDYYLKARALNVPRASNNLGVLYINNKNMSESNPNSKVNSESVVQQNIQKGMRYLQEAQQLGFAQAYYNIGCIYQNGILGRKNLHEALVNYYKGGLKGDIQSRLKFVYQLMNQTSIIKDQYQDHYRVAHRWLDSIIHKIEIIEDNTPSNSQIKMSYTSAQKAQALFYLGLMYEYGFGTEKNPKQAFNYFTQSSDMGYSVAKNKVGDCYFSGYGVKQDIRLAIGCYLQAAELFNSDAMVNLGSIYLNGISGIIEKNQNEAIKYFSKAMDQQNSNAMVHLSHMYKNGLGVEKDRQIAKKLLEKSAINKNPTALYMLKEMGGNFNDQVLFNNLDNDFFTTPRKINIRQIVPYVNQIKH